MPPAVIALPNVTVSAAVPTAPTPKTAVSPLALSQALSMALFHQLLDVVFQVPLPSVGAPLPAEFQVSTLARDCPQRATVKNKARRVRWRCTGKSPKKR